MGARSRKGGFKMARTSIGPPPDIPCLSASKHLALHNLCNEPLQLGLAFLAFEVCSGGKIFYPPSYLWVYTFTH